MVNYSVDTLRRRQLTAIIAILSVALAAIVRDHLPHNLDAPSTMAIFGGLYWLFDRYVWRLSFMRSATGVPNLNGEWRGHLMRKDDEGCEQEVAVTLTVTQTWSTADLVLESWGGAELSRRTMSHADVIGMFVQNPNVLMVKWMYHHAQGEGVTQLRLGRAGGADTLTGYYYSTRLRGGDIAVTRC